MNMELVFSLFKTINDNYAALLSLISSVVMVIVTIIYVKQTKRQAESAEKSVEMVTKQMILEKQPCIIPEIVSSSGSAFGESPYTRIQLGFDIKLKNVGDTAAINVFTLARIELQHLFDCDGKGAELGASLEPYFVQAIRQDQDHDVRVHFETKEVLTLLKDLEFTMEKNWERIKNNPAENHVRGPKLVITVLYKNLMEQWYESTLSTEIAWLEYVNPPEQKTHNINENTIPPKTIVSGDDFFARLTASRYAPFSVKTQTQEYVNSRLEKYEKEDPDIAGNRNMMLNL